MKFSIQKRNENERIRARWWCNGETQTDFQFRMAIAIIIYRKFLKWNQTFFSLYSFVRRHFRLNEQFSKWNLSMPLTRLLWVSRKMAVVEVERTNTENERKQIRNKSSQSKENEAKRRFLCMVLHSLEAQWPNEREQSEQKKHRRRKMGRKKMK